MKKPEFVTKIQTKIAPYKPYLFAASAAILTVVVYETTIRPDFAINCTKEAKEGVAAGTGGLRKKIDGIDYALVRADLLEWKD